jgi:Icc-related predicted phosphoesterase
VGRTGHPRENRTTPHRRRRQAKIHLDLAAPQSTARHPVAWTGREDGGDAVALEWIQRFQPDFVFSGHIHNAPFYAAGSWHSRIGKSVIFNAGKQPGGEPTHIVLDLKSRRADWTSIESSESLDV